MHQGTQSVRVLVVTLQLLYINASSIDGSKHQQCLVVVMLQSGCIQYMANEVQCDPLEHLVGSKKDIATHHVVGHLIGRESPRLLIVRNFSTFYLSVKTLCTWFQIVFVLQIWISCMRGCEASREHIWSLICVLTWDSVWYHGRVYIRATVPTSIYKYIGFLMKHILSHRVPKLISLCISKCLLCALLYSGHTQDDFELHFQVGVYAANT